MGCEPWPEPPGNLALRPGEVHVWLASLVTAPPGLCRNLSTDELARAGRLRFRRDREQFIAARGLLRALLARYLNAEAKELRFRYGQWGKPALAEGDLRFNVSHAAGLALYAVARGSEVGVDVEPTQPRWPCEALARRFLPHEEAERLNAVPAAGRLEAFLACWTRREALAKAVGRGLALALQPLELPWPPDVPAFVACRPGDEERPVLWSLQGLSPAAGYLAALAVQGAGWRLSCWRYPRPVASC